MATYRNTAYPPRGVSIVGLGDIVWAQHRADDARRPLPSSGDTAILSVHVGHDTYQTYMAKFEEVGALATQVGGNYWCVAWRLVRLAD